jgi:hypothetical protein
MPYDHPALPLAPMGVTSNHTVSEGDVLGGKRCVLMYMYESFIHMYTYVDIYDIYIKYVYIYYTHYLHYEYICVQEQVVVPRTCPLVQY